MSAVLDQMLARVKELSSEELVTLLERVANQLRHDIVANKQTKLSASYLTIEGAYRLTAQEAEAGLEDIFTASELAEIEATDISNLPPLPQSLAQMISEDREDRL